MNNYLNALVLSDEELRSAIPDDARRDFWKRLHELAMNGELCLLSEAARDKQVYFPGLVAAYIAEAGRLAARHMSQQLHISWDDFLDDPA